MKLNERNRLCLVVAVVWVLQATFTTLNTGFFQQFSGNEPRWLAVSIYNYSDAIGWTIMSIIIFRLVEYFMKANFNWTKMILVHLILSILFASIQRLIAIALSYHLILWTEAVDLSLLKIENFFGANFLRYILNGVLTYSVITTISYGYIYYKTSQQYFIDKIKLKSELSRTKVENLKLQLQPHFLFNSLQSVSTIMHRDLNSADRALGDLGDMLRFSVNTMDTQLINIKEEIFYLEKYLKLQKTRFQDQLTYSFEIDPSLLHINVPPFLLQPLVENSIKHGIFGRGEPVNIDIIMKKKEDKVYIICRDQYNSLTFSKAINEGMGLSNLKKRLDTIYGDDAELQFGYHPYGFESKITLHTQNVENGL